MRIGLGLGITLGLGNGADTFMDLVGAKTLESYGAVGGGVVSDQAAITLAAAALAARTAKTIYVGGTSYLGTWGFAVPGSSTIAGQGQQSILSVSGGAAALTIGAVNDVTIRDLMLQGDGTVNAHAYGIEIGTSGVANSGTNRTLLFNVQAAGFWAGGFLYRKSLSGTSHQGPHFVACVARDCSNYGFFIDQQGEYLQMVGCEATGCTYGVWMAAGNSSITGGNFSTNSYGIYLSPGTNAAHGNVNGATINHNSTANVYVDAIDIGHTFNGCDLFGGPITAVGNTALVDFTGCRVSPTAMTCTNGMLRFMDCEFDSTTFTITTSGTGWIEFINCRGSDGTMPASIQALVQTPYTFSSDANKTLTSQQSVAETLIIASGTLSATRTLTSVWGPAAGRKMRIKNGNAQSVTYLWSSGTGITVAGGATALIGGDGTNAILLGS